MSSPASSDRISPQLIGAITATGILAFLGIFLEMVLNVLFPALMADFSVTMADVQWMTSGYLLVVSTVMPITGWLQRRFTPRSLFFTAAAAIFAGAMVAALAPTYPVLLFGRLVQGLGTGIVTPLMFTIILTRSPRSKVGALMGVGALVMGTAPALGPILGAVIGTVASWRAVFWIGAIVVLISVCFGWVSINGGQETSRVSLDIVQVAFIALTFVGLVLGVERTGSALAEGASLIIPLGLIILGIVGAVLFVVRSRSAAIPVIRLSVLGAPTYRYSLLAYAFFQFSALGLGYLLPNAAQLALGSSAMSAGVLVLPGAILGAVMSLIGGSLLDRFGPRTPIFVGSVIILVACVAAAAQGTSLSGVWMSASYFVFMLGFGMAFANTQTHAMAHVDGPLTADGTALMNTVQQFFGAIAMTILATIMSMTQAGLTTADAGFASATARGVFIGFVVVAVIAAAALGFELLAMRHSRIASGAQAITAEEMIEADEIEADKIETAVLAEIGDSAQVSGR